MRSSYAQNNYKDVFTAILRGFCPKNCVELGVLDGYSTLAIGAALKKNGQGELTAYDLFEDYQFKHGNQAEVQSKLEEYGLEKIVTLYKRDAFTVHDLYLPCTVDLLHVDISNTGETISRIMSLWNEKMVCGGIIIFEGGTKERDEIEWMKKYNAPSIKDELEKNQIIKDNYIFGTYLRFPGLTMLLKKR